MYSINDFIRELKKEGLLVSSRAEDKYILGIADNSQNVRDAYLFVCKGRKFKQDYLVDAVSKGAVCYMSETEYDAGSDISSIIVSDIRKAMTILALEFYDYPSDRLDVVGITGTKGKTTSVHFLKSALDEWDRAERGVPCGLISTMEVYDGNTTVKSSNTTPEPIVLNDYLNRMADNGMKHCALEVSSQALKYGRVDGINLKIAAFLSLGRDHISPLEHKDFEDYYSSKLRIFEHSDTGIINLDSEGADRTISYASEKSDRVLTYSLRDESADFYAYDIERDGDHTKFKVKSKEFAPQAKEQEFRIAIPGIFNVANATAVIAICTLLGEPMQFVRKGIEDVVIEGRMEMFKSKDGTILAIADYAHNELSFEALFDAVEQAYPEHYKNLRVIFGSVGDKADDRKEELGRVCGRRAKMSYIAADDPGHVAFEDIAVEIAHYVELENGDYEIIEDRSEAIEKAFADADGKTAILACGLGRLTEIKYGDEYIHRESDADCIIRCIKAYDEGHM